MIRKLISAALVLWLLPGLGGCAADLAVGIIKELEDHEDGIRQELEELWDAFLEEAGDWLEAFAAHSVTGDRDLAGSRETGGDDYAGIYDADYSEFDAADLPVRSSRIQLTASVLPPSPLPG